MSTIGTPVRSHSDITREILDAVFLTGADLSVYLEPDTSGPLSQTKELYSESYQLPFVISQDNQTFAFTGGDHLSTPAHSANLYRSYYAYSNVCDAWIHFFPALKDGSQVANSTLMSLANYRVVEWIARKPKQIVFDSGNKEMDAKLIRQAIHDGMKFVVSLQEPSGLWRQLPVDLAFYWEERKTFQFQTAIHWYPEMFDSPQTVARELAAINFPDRTDPRAQSTRLEQSLAAACTYRSIFLDGTLQSLTRNADLSDETWERLIVFTDG